MNPRKITFILLMILPIKVHAFPEMVRHGYVNCITCHVSPNGGGVMTPYGRELSREVLSAWGTENETRFVGFFKTPEWVNLGGDVRLLQYYQDNILKKKTKFMLMQADAEVAVTINKITVDATAGVRDNEFMSRRYY